MRRIERFHDSLHFDRLDVSRIVEAQLNGIIETYTLTTMSTLNARRDTDICLWCGRIPSIDHDCKSKPDYNSRFAFGEEGEGVAFVKVSRYGMQFGKEHVLEDDKLDPDAHKLSDEVPEPNTSDAHQVFDGMSKPNSSYSFGLSVGIALNVDYSACHDHPKINNIEHIMTTSGDLPSKTKDGPEISDAHKVLDETHIPDFIREMAQTVRFEEGNSIECNLDSASNIIPFEMISARNSLMLGELLEVNAIEILGLDLSGFALIEGHVLRGLSTEMRYEIVLIESENGWMFHLSNRNIDNLEHLYIELPWVETHADMCIKLGNKAIIDFISVFVTCVHCDKTMHNCFPIANGHICHHRVMGSYKYFDPGIKVFKEELFYILTLEDKGDFMEDGMVIGNHYLGEWRNGVISGKGVLVWENGRGFDSVWDNGVCKMTINSNSMLDCEFLETGGIMDYSLLVGIHFRNDNTGDKTGMSPFVLLGKKPSFHNGKYLCGHRFLEAELQDMVHLLSGGFGNMMPSRNGLSIFRAILFTFDPGGLEYKTYRDGHGVVDGTGVGASQGILIKGGQALETAHKVKCIVFDKTGTLTEEKPLVVSTRLLKQMVLCDFYEPVAAMEVNSEHPLAKVVMEYGKTFIEDNENPMWPKARELVAITGHGVKAIVQNKEILVGNKSLKLDQGFTVSIEAEELLKEAEGMAQMSSGIIMLMHWLTSFDGGAPGAICLVNMVMHMLYRVKFQAPSTDQNLLRCVHLHNRCAQSESRIKRSLIMINWVFDCGGNYGSKTVMGVDFLKTVRGKIKKSTIMNGLNTIGNRKALHMSGRHKDYIFGSSYFNNQSFVFDPGGGTWLLACILSF